MRINLPRVPRRDSIRRPVVDRLRGVRRLCEHPLATICMLYHPNAIGESSIRNWRGVGETPAGILRRYFWQQWRTPVHDQGWSCGI
jgi:hypothetical protein